MREVLAELSDVRADLFGVGEQLIPKVESIIQQIRATMPKIEQTGGTDDDDDYYAAFEWESHNLGELLLIKG